MMHDALVRYLDLNTQSLYQWNSGKSDNALQPLSDLTQDSPASDPRTNLNTNEATKHHKEAYYTNAKIEQIQFFCFLLKYLFVSKKLLYESRRNFL